MPNELIYVGTIALLVGYIVGDLTSPVSHAAASALYTMTEAVEQDQETAEDAADEGING